MEVLAPSMTVVEKLQIKDEKNLLIQGLPSTIEKQFAKLSFSKNVTPLLKSKKIDLALVFAINHRQLSEILKDVVPALQPDAKLWIAYPKVSSKIVSDLSRDCNWACIQQLGLECIRTVALDNTWCAMRFRKSDDINRSPFSIASAPEGIDYVGRTVCIPEDLDERFNLYPDARFAFDSLSFTNRKEYLVWINAAKKEETRNIRLEATIQKLIDGKRNPSEK